MSGLAAVLAGRAPSGVFRWHAAYDVADVRHTVEHAGWRFGYVDGWTATSKDELLAAVGEALHLPDYYGRNLDALEECLTEVDRPTVLLWDGWTTLARDDDRSFRSMVEIFAGRSERLTVLLRGDGPEIDVPGIDVPSLD
jgi:RNAse (barnase) inhibitor barstar